MSHDLKVAPSTMTAMSLQPLARQLLVLSAAALSLVAQAGRPMMVDDAGVNDAGAGHLETWFERGPGGHRAWTAAPAYAPIEGLEVGAAVSRDTTERSTALRLQGKLQFTRPTEDACGHAAVLGIAHERPKAVNARWFNLVMSCPVAPGNVHLNLGATQTARKSAKAFIGAAWEQDLGWASGHVEWIAAQSAQPIVNLGLRREIGKGLQLDGSVGRQAGRTLFSVGLKQQF